MATARQSTDSTAATSPPAPGSVARQKPTLARVMEARRARQADGFANVVAVLMRDAGTRNLRIADLEWLVLPAVNAGQFRLAQLPMKRPGAKPEDQTGDVLVPVGAALWARVSPEVDKRLTETLDQPLVLAPNEWTSGDILWLVAVAGDRKALPTFIKQLESSVFAGKTVKMRVTGADGKVSVRTLGAAA